MARRLASVKARQVARGLRRGLVLGADTIVVLDGRCLGKPTSDRSARAMLRSLSGRSHQVLTGLALVDAADGWTIAACARSTVRFRKLRDEEITRYVATGEPMDKAGAYAIQGEGRRLVASHRGSLSNIIGLPLELLEKLLARAGRRAR